MRYLAIMVALVFASSAADAFQEQQIGAGPGRPAAPQPESAQAAPGAALGETVVPPVANGGTEIRIPGLGKLGVIPKMDFGLELLYGATDTKRKGDERTETEDQQLMIRGAIKHKF